jgi:di/tricarboxylate transporter
MNFRVHCRSLRKLGTTRSGLIVCLVLVALLAVMQVPHLHKNANDADHCALCVVMHSAAPAAPPVAAVVLVPLGFSAPVVKPKSIIRYWHPQLFTRPPPSLLQA